jgi:hypothetical protein
MRRREFPAAPPGPFNRISLCSGPRIQSPLSISGKSPRCHIVFLNAATFLVQMNIVIRKLGIKWYTFGEVCAFLRV